MRLIYVPPGIDEETLRRVLAPHSVERSYDPRKLYGIVVDTSVELALSVPIPSKDRTT